MILLNQLEAIKAGDGAFRGGAYLEIHKQTNFFKLYIVILIDMDLLAFGT